MSIFSHHSRTFTSRRARSQRGFTLIELLAVMAIMVVVTSILLVRQQQFNSSTLLRSLGYSVALSIQQAQVYGVSIIQSSASTGSGNFVPAYGIYVNSTDPTHYYLFGDQNGNGQDDFNTGSCTQSNGQINCGENVQIFTLGNGYTISNFCAGSACKSNGQIKWLTIVFHRPNPEACFATDTQPAGCAVNTTQPSPYGTASIQLSSQGGSTRSVQVTSTGEIAVEGNNT